MKDMVIEDKQEDIELLPSKHKVIKKKETSKNSTVILLKDSQEFFRSEIDSQIIEISLEHGTIFMRTLDSICAYDIQTESFIYNLPLPTILSISVFKNLLAISSLNRLVCIYKDNVCMAGLRDPKAIGDITSVHISSNICTVLYSSGYVSCFNINDTQCFRSFRMSEESTFLCSTSCISEDGCFLFASDGTKSIKVIDLIKGRLLDTITLNSAIIKVIFYKDFLYTLELDKILTKHSVFSGLTDSVALEDIPLSCSIRNTAVLVSTTKGIVAYDLNLNHIDSLSVKLEARNRGEMYIKSRPVEQLDFNASYIFCAGQSNSLKVFENSLDSKGYKPKLIKNSLVQIIQVSRNRDMENFGSKLFREKQEEFDKSNLISVNSLFFSNDKLYVQTKADLCIYERVVTSFQPIEFDVIPTEEFIRNNLDNSLKSLIAALRLNDCALINLVINNCTDLEFAVNFLPQKYARPLLEFAFEVVKQDFTNLKVLKIIQMILVTHNVTIPGLLESLSSGAVPSYLEVKKNKFLISAISKQPNSNK